MSSWPFFKINLLFSKKFQAILKTSSIIKKTNFYTFGKSNSYIYKLNNKSKFYAYNLKFEKMISIRYNEKTEKINLALKVNVPNSKEREFTLNRNLDEELGNTLQRLYSTYIKQVNIALNKANKKMKKNDPENDNSNRIKSETTNKEMLDENSLPLTLYDLENNTVPLTTKNKDAWRENYTFKFSDQSYKVTVNLPALKKISLTKTLFAGMSALVKIEVEPECDFDELNTHSFFSWFVSDETFQSSESEKFKMPHQGILDKMKWNLLDEGLNKKSHVLNDDCENRLIKSELMK